MKIIFCDDQPGELERYSAILDDLAKKHGIDMELIQYQSGNDLLFDFDDAGYIADIIFLDINMPGISGVEVAHELRKHKYMNELVFITCSKETTHLLKAFDVKAINYIVKDETDKQRFEEIFLNAVESAREKESEYILYRAYGDKRYIEVSTIKYYEVSNRLITVYYGDTGFEFFSTLDKIEKDLEFEGFVRIHRAFLVAVSQIERITTNSVYLRCGKELPLGKTYAPRVKAAMKNSAAYSGK